MRLTKANTVGSRPGIIAWSRIATPRVTWMYTIWSQSSTRTPAMRACSAARRSTSSRHCSRLRGLGMRSSARLRSSRAMCSAKRKGRPR